MNLEIKTNWGSLQYEREYNLNMKPLEIDLFIIKKGQIMCLENEIGADVQGAQYSGI